MCGLKIRSGLLHIIKHRAAVPIFYKRGVKLFVVNSYSSHCVFIKSLKHHTVFKLANLGDSDDIFTL